MSVVRIIPRLDIKGPNLVKGIHLEGLRVLGRPSDFAIRYYEQGADELLFMDVVASLYERNSLHEIISETAKSIFIPITVGGGLRSIDDMRQVLRAGADKVCLNTAAIRNPQLIADASNIFGSSTVVVAIEAIKEKDGTYLAYTDNGREHTGVEVRSWAKKVNELGAGEIIITSVDREGTGQGFDIELVHMVAEAVDIPVVAHGGVGNVRHITELITSTHVEAVSVASILHYDYILDHSSVVSDQEGNSEFLKSKGRFGLIDPIDIPSLKKSLVRDEINCRV
jgi:imidazole glycerol-phosphate synthase subunit HisF